MVNILHRFERDPTHALQSPPINLFGPTGQSCLYRMRLATGLALSFARPGRVFAKSLTVAYNPDRHSRESGNPERFDHVEASGFLLAQE